VAVAGTAVFHRPMVAVAVAVVADI